MDFNFMPSLERRALIKVGITLWNPGAIPLDDIEWGDNKWIAEDHVIGKVKELSLPESLKNKISGFIKPIGFEILKWINHYQNILSNDKIDVYSRSKLMDVKKVEKSLSKLCWTPQGTVDRKKTAEELIRDDNLHLTERYKLACIYCVRKDILKLWNRMAEYCRKSFYSDSHPGYVDQNALVVFWTYDIKGEQTRMTEIFQYLWPYCCTPYEYAFIHAVRYRNKVAIEYFLQNLTSERREQFLVRAAGLICDPDDFVGEDDGDVLFFLLSQMNVEQQLEMLKKYSWDVLTRLLEWPWQDLFMETANYMEAFLSGDDFLTLLENILNNVGYGYKDYDYKKLFREFWQQSPITHKGYVTDMCAQTDLLLYLLEIEDKEYFKIIFASIPDREKLLFSDGGKSFCASLISSDKMDLLEVFVRECISSKEIIIKFREELENHIIHHQTSIKNTPEENRDMWNKFFQSIDEHLEDDNQKYMDE